MVTKVKPVNPDALFNSEKNLYIVTGAASGIGAATLKLLSQKGALVLALDLEIAGMERVVGELPQGSGNIILRKCDLSKEESIAKVFREFGNYSLTALLNIAALASPNLDISELPTSTWDRVLNVNVRGIFLMSKYALPLFKNAGGGVIVNVSSVHAYASMPNNSVYAASKGAVNALTAELALELNSKNIRVVGVAPGSVRTPMTTRNIRKDGAKLRALGFPTDGKSIGHVGEPEEIAEALVWISSPAASFVNGTTFVVDGGLLARLVN